MNIVARKLKLVASQRLLAKEFGLNRKTVSRIKFTKHRKNRIDPNVVKEFFFREDISRVMPGKRYATKLGPGYLLQVPLQSAFELFKSVHPNLKIGFSKFASLRPKNVRLLNNSHREYCVCVYCINVRYKVLCLDRITTDRNKKLITELKLLDVISCPKSDNERFHHHACIEGNCQKCKNVKQSLEEYYKLPKEQQVNWNRWENKTMDNGNNRRILVTKKGTVTELLDEFVKDVSQPSQGMTFKKHLFNAHWQYMQYQSIKKNLPQECILQVIDFAKNRTITYQDEIKSAFFGARQVTVHPVVSYYHGKQDIVRDSTLFLSDDIKHDYHMVNHILKKADQHLKSRMGEKSVKQKIIFSDGCASQYKSKGPFADVSLNQKCKISRNYYGSEHGKGEGDGEIGIIGRALERAVIGRKVIINSAEDMCSWLEDNMTLNEPYNQRHFVFVKVGEVERYRPYTEVKTVANTRKFHQVENVIGQPYNLKVRSNSCFCGKCLESEAVNECTNSAYVDEKKTVTLTRVAHSDVIVEDIPHDPAEMVLIFYFYSYLILFINHYIYNKNWPTLFYELPKHCLISCCSN